EVRPEPIVSIATTTAQPDNPMRIYIGAVAIALLSFVAGVSFDRFFAATRSDVPEPPELAVPTSPVAASTGHPSIALDDLDGPEDPEPVRPSGTGSIAADRGDPLLDFEDARAAYAYGDRSLKEGRRDAAFGALERAIELNPAFALAHRRLG